MGVSMVGNGWLNGKQKRVQEVLIESDIKAALYYLEQNAIAIHRNTLKIIF